MIYRLYEGCDRVLWMQWGAVAVGVVVLLFFVSFTGYYFRNRRAAMQLRRRMQDLNGDLPGAQSVPPESYDEEGIWQARG